MAEKKAMLVNRAIGLVRVPVEVEKRVRNGKTSKDRAKRGGEGKAARK